MTNQHLIAPTLTLQPVHADNWRGVADLRVHETQRDFVAEPCRYLALCAYGQQWQPLAIMLADRVIGFLMWAVDPADGACWLGGILIDQTMQSRGYGRRAVELALIQLAAEHGFTHFALSYQPANTVARRLYLSLGFVETDDWEDDERIARLTLAP
jgi:diamine N-acetyltransferase